MLLAHQIDGMPDHALAEPGLPRYLYGKRAAGLPDGELEERLHRATVIQHSAVDDAGRLFRKMLEVGVVGGDDAEHAFLHQLAQYSLRYRTAHQRLGTRSHLINENEGSFVRLTQESTHVTQVRRIGGQFVLNRLLVAYVYHQLVEEPCPALFRNRH